MPPTPEVLELDVAQMELQLNQIEAALGEPAARPFRLLLGWHLSVLGLIERKNITLKRLRRLLFGPSSERTRNVAPQSQSTPSQPLPAPPEPTPPAASSAEPAEPG